MDRELVEAEDFAAEAFEDSVALELERRELERPADDHLEALYDDQFDTPELYEPSPYDGTYSEM